MLWPHSEAVPVSFDRGHVLNVYYSMLMSCAVCAFMPLCVNNNWSQSLAPTGTLRLRLHSLVFGLKTPRSSRTLPQPLQRSHRCRQISSVRPPTVMQPMHPTSMCAAKDSPWRSVIMLMLPIDNSTKMIRTTVASDTEPWSWSPITAPVIPDAMIATSCNGIPGAALVFHIALQGAWTHYTLALRARVVTERR